MKRRFEQAIRQVGGLARLPDDSSPVFPVSIQPEHITGDSHTAIGTGFFSRFTLYTVCDPVTEKLREGSVIEYRGVKYFVQSIENIYFRDEPVFRQGILVREQEGEL